MSLKQGGVRGVFLIVVDGLSARVWILLLICFFELAFFYLDLNFFGLDELEIVQVRKIIYSRNFQNFVKFSNKSQYLKIFKNSKNIRNFQKFQNFQRFSNFQDYHSVRALL